VADPIGAMTGLLLLQVPPAVLSVKAVVCPIHTDVAPMIAKGNGLTVTVVVTVQPARE